MTKFYIVFGILVTGAFGYANTIGLSVYDAMKSGQWGPRGQGVHHSGSHVGGVHTYYHK